MILNKFSKIIDLLKEHNGVLVIDKWTLKGYDLDQPSGVSLELLLDDVAIYHTNDMSTAADDVLIEHFNREFGLDYVRSGTRCIVSIVDYIYNFHNLKLVKNNGSLYQSAIDESVKRFSNDSFYPFTDYLYNKLVELGLDRNQFPYSPGRFEYLRHGTDQNKLWYTRSGVHTRINGEIVTAPPHIDYNKWGYKKITMRNRGVGDPFETWIPINGETVIIDGFEYPKSYADRYFPICPACMTRSTKLFMNKCASCLGVDPAKVQIRGYSDRAPSFLKFKEGKYSKALFKSPLYLGVELELESDGRRGQDGLDKGLLFAAKTLGDHCIFKRDGSINNGFEIVSTAATLDVHREEWKDFFAGVETESYLGKRDNVGMHVHVSREPLNFLTQGKMTEFMNREDNKEYLRKVAGRWSDHYARQETGRTVTYPFLTGEGSERYNALNLRNKATVEFRIFAATTKYDEFIMRLEFCEALAYYCSPCQSKATSLKDVTKWEWFAKYVFENSKQWPLLAKFIKGL